MKTALIGVVSFIAWSGVLAQSPPVVVKPPVALSAAEALDAKVLEEIKTRSELLPNLQYLSDEIGPRLTGSANLKRANEWAAARMKSYGLDNVHQEPWLMPEGWERGTASARLVEPNTGVRLSLASGGWAPGTNGKVTADVVILKANSMKELADYKGKLKGAVVLSSPPARVSTVEQPGQSGQPTRPTERPAARPTLPMTDRQQPPPVTEDRRAFARERADFLKREGVVAILQDSGKPYGLLVTTGGWQGMDRPSASNRLPTLYVAHHHYDMLYRLASRPTPARTRIELEVSNNFVPGPLAVNNTVGEIRGTEKPDEYVIVGAHLDSWDLAQGTTDNGTGSSVVLEAARALARSGVKPRRTIRFVLFTGEEQGLHGSKAYVEQHKEEMAKVSACLVHDTGTGKVQGIDARHRPAVQPILEKELVSLKPLGITDFRSSFISGSDHASFERAGAPGLLFRLDMSTYRMTHHTQIDTLDTAIDENLRQAAQAMAITAMRLANLDTLLPREKEVSSARPTPAVTPAVTPVETRK